MEGNELFPSYEKKKLAEKISRYLLKSFSDKSLK